MLTLFLPLDKLKQYGRVVSRNNKWTLVYWPNGQLTYSRSDHYGALDECNLRQFSLFLVFGKFAVIFPS
jgi:hypothetical protein